MHETREQRDRVAAWRGKEATRDEAAGGPAGVSPLKAGAGLTVSVGGAASDGE